MLTLTEFLLARIAEDEAVAQKKAGTLLALNSPERPVQMVDSPFSPSRVLAECEAKRQIVEDFEEYARDYHDAPSPYAEGRRHAALLAVTRAAAVYADHPDYRPEWRP